MIVLQNDMLPLYMSVKSAIFKGILLKAKNG